MNLGLKGRVAVVTGASRGIGKAIARGLADEGVHLALMARDQAAISAAADDIHQTTGVRVLGLAVDVRSGPAVQEACAEVVRAFGVVHIVENNAGGPIKRQDV